MPGWIVLIIIIVLMGVGIFFLYRRGKKMQKQQEESQEQINAAKQPVSMLIIDKKKMRLKNAGLPQVVLDQTPKLYRLSKVPVVKAKVGPQIMTLICDDKIFDSVPVKKEVKAMVSGIYIVEVRGLRGKSLGTPSKKKGFLARAREKAEQAAGAKSLK